MKISQLAPESRDVNLTVKVLERSEVKEFYSQHFRKKFRVCNATVGDETGIIKMTLWNEQVDDFYVGDTIQIRNAHIAVFKGHMRLQLGKHSNYRVLTTKIGKINLSNDMSEATYNK